MENGMDIAVIVVVSGFVISALTLITNIIITYIDKKSDKKREVNLKILQMAFKEYELRTNYGLKQAEKDKTALLYPFDYFLIFYSKLADLINKGKLSETEVKNMLEDMEDIARIYLTRK